jgi:hypothetical protein
MATGPQPTLLRGQGTFARPIPNIPLRVATFNIAGGSVNLSPPFTWEHAPRANSFNGHEALAWKFSDRETLRSRLWLNQQGGNCMFDFREHVRKFQMQIAFTVAMSVALLVAQNSHAEANKTCISKATEALPHIAGLVIKRSRARSVSPSILASWRGQSQPIIIDVEFVAAGEAQTYSYMCVVAHGSAFVQRTMN